MSDVLARVSELFLRSSIGIDPTSRDGRQLVGLASPVEIRAGENVAINHSQISLLYIAQGATKLCAQASQGRCQIVGFHFGGDFFTVPADGSHKYKLSTLCDSSLIRFSAREFQARAMQDPRILRFLYEETLAALQRSSEKLVSLGQKTASERVCGFLLSMVRRLDSTDSDRCIIDLPMSRREIGESLGLTIETVSRQLSELKAKGLIETHGRSRVEICKLAALAKQAGHFDHNESAVEPI